MYQLDKIKPKKAKISDKYSWNLYKFLKNKNHSHYRVYWFRHNRWDGGIVEFGEFNNIKSPSRHIVIGYQVQNKGTYGGAFLNEIMQSANATVWSLMLYHPDRFVDITDWFMENYIKYGRCLIDKNHITWFEGDKERFTQATSNSKKCNWCGEWFKRKIEKQVQIKRVEKWISQKESGKS